MLLLLLLLLQALMHRLQSAQASRSLRRDTLLDDYSRQTIAGSAPHAASPLRLTHKKHNPYSLRCRSDASFDDASVTSSTSSRWSAGGQGRPRSAVSSISKASSATGRPRSATLRRKRKPEAPRPEWQAGWWPADVVTSAFSCVLTSQTSGSRLSCRSLRNMWFAILVKREIRWNYLWTVTVERITVMN